MKEKSPYVMTRVRRTTNKKLKLLAVNAGCTMIELIARLARAEEKRKSNGN